MNLEEYEKKHWPGNRSGEGGRGEESAYSLQTEGGRRDKRKDHFHFETVMGLFIPP